MIDKDYERQVCEDRLTEDLLQRLNVVLIKAFANELQNFYYDNNWNQYAILKTNKAVMGVEFYSFCLWAMESEYFRNRNIILTREEFNNEVEKFKKQRRKLCEKARKNVIAYLFNFSMKVVDGDKANYWSNMFDIKFCDEEFVIGRIRETHRDAYPLILHELVKQVTNECED